MRSQLLFILITLSGFAFQGDKTTVTKWVVISGSSLKVDGSTNVNTFSCAISAYSRPDTIIVNRTNEPVHLKGSIRLDVQGFDCHKAAMTADLRKTLKAKEFPQLKIQFLSIQKYPYANIRREITKGVIVIELAGVAKRFEINYQIVSAESTYINLVGSRKLNFSDFNLEPPRKLGGMIQADDELSVVFNLRIKVL
jgi:hypothetical protein